MAEDKENQSPISTSTSNSSQLTTSTSSTKERSGEDRIQRVGKKTQLRRTSHSATHRHFSLNKSSSSGTTTTSGSVATVELLQRLKRLEMPSLQRPPAKSSILEKDDLNTSADMKKATELDSSPAIDPSFLFSTDLEEDQIPLSSSSRSS